MRNPDPTLHDALRDVVRIHVPSRRRFGCQVENVFVLLIGKRARQFQRAGFSREQVLTRLLEELAPPQPERAHPAGMRDHLGQIFARFTRLLDQRR